MTKENAKRPSKIALRDLLVYVSKNTSSNRELARRTGHHPDFIRKIKLLLPKCPFDVANLESVTDTQIKAWLASFSSTKIEIFDEPDVVALAKILAAKASTRAILFDEYQKTPSCNKKMALRSFNRRIADFQNLPDLVLRIDHEPGESMQIDYAGYRPPYCDRKAGINVKRDLFITTLGTSAKIFATSTSDQTTPEWLRAHIEAIEFYGGAARVWVCDNLKAAVISHNHRGRIKLNPSYRQLASYYGALIQPARPYRPRDKGRVEACVKLVQRELRASLDAKPVFSADELDQRICEVVENINKRVLPRLLGESRSTLFDSIDKPSLNQLPATRFDVFDVAVGKLIARDYTIEFEGNFYSVDYRLVGRRVEVHASATAVMIMDDGVVVATHPRLSGRGERSMKIEHRPSNHVAMLLTDRERLDAKLDELLPASRAFIELAIDSQSKAVSRRAALAAALDLAVAYGPAELNAAVAWCETIPTNSISSLERSLVGKTYLRVLSAVVPPQAPLSDANVRGPDYYSGGSNRGQGQ